MMRFSMSDGQDGRQRIWANLTGKGRKAFSAHVAELTRLAALTG